MSFACALLPPSLKPNRSFYQRPRVTQTLRQAPSRFIKLNRLINRCYFRLVLADTHFWASNFCTFYDNVFIARNILITSRAGVQRDSVRILHYLLNFKTILSYLDPARSRRFWLRRYPYLARFARSVSFSWRVHREGAALKFIQPGILLRAYT